MTRPLILAPLPWECGNSGFELTAFCNRTVLRHIYVQFGILLYLYLSVWRSEFCSCCRRSHNVFSIIVVPCSADVSSYNRTRTNTGTLLNLWINVSTCSKLDKVAFWITDPSWRNSNNRQNPPIRQNRHNFWTNTLMQFWNPLELRMSKTCTT